MRLKDRTALVIGGARGMGKAIALRFAAEGCSVAIGDVRDEDGERTAAEIRSRGRDAMYMHCDATDSSQVKATVADAIARLKKIDILVYTAGIGRPPRPIEEISEDEYDRIVAINMKGVFLCCQAIAPHMKQNRYGKVIIISSLAGITASPFHIPYAAAKAGALHISTSFAIEMAKYNVCVNAILPGMIRTDMTRDFAPPWVQDLDAFMAEMAKGIPLGREGTVEDIASVALFLASEESSYVTADRICVGGGNPYRAVQ